MFLGTKKTDVEGAIQYKNRNAWLRLSPSTGFLYIYDFQTDTVPTSTIDLRLIAQVKRDNPKPSFTITLIGLGGTKTKHTFVDPRPSKEPIDWVEAISHCISIVESTEPQQDIKLSGGVITNITRKVRLAPPKKKKKKKKKKSTLR
eukprot:TRINITY_DN11303_c0_g2_i3.p1 TRINITY_DN11303_c0_g2~~TRINITY_DN11303_c0_g2_i3.p1  ORF type:complete len:146 (+),score=22.09 TRINITY_DN11303_c0_g2_i3:173-610(+)